MKKDIRLPIMFAGSEVDAIDDWRYAKRIASRAKAVRTLIERGLAADAEKNSDGGASLVASTAVTENRTDVSAPDSHITGNGELPIMNVHTNSTSFAIPATVFQNSQFGSIRVAECHGEPWFVASDICSALDIRNPSSSLALLDDDEKGVHTMETLGGVQEMATVSEPGLYSLILRSRKREAKTFKRWITHDVIPTIRKHGMYATPQTIEAMLADPDTTIRILTELKTERERRIEAERTKAQISSRREATVMGKLSASAREVNRLRDELGASTRHATIKAVQKAIGKEFPRNGYVALRNWCKENGETAVDVPDSNYETVKAWPAEAWKAVYGIELAKIFKVATTVDGETLQ